VIVREIQKEGMPVAFITAMSMVGQQTGASRVVVGTKLRHPCGDPNLPEETDLALRREIVKCALRALQMDVNDPTIFVPNILSTPE